MTAKMLRLTIALSLAAFFSSAAEAQIYKWVDEDGVVHYADQPQHKDAKPSEIKTARTDREAARENLANSIAQDREQTNRFYEARDPNPDEVDPAEAARVAEFRRQSCEAARKKMNNFAQARRLYTLDEDGAKVYLDEDQTLSARAEVQAAITEYCN